MARPSQAILDFMSKHGINSDEIWQVPDGAWVIRHKALERAADEAGVEFDDPQIATRDFSGEGVAVLVIGKLGAKRAWSFGEASNLNLTRKSEKRPLYPWAMAEKRAKDRVILKLLSVAGELYSEEESDDFKRPNPHVTRPEDVMPRTEYDQNGQPIDNIPAPSPEAVKKLRVVDQRPIFEAMQKEIWATKTSVELSTWAETNKDRLGSLKPDWQEFLRGVYAEHRDALRQQERGDTMRMAG